jgi:hypothetical protein
MDCGILPLKSPPIFPRAEVGELPERFLATTVIRAWTPIQNSKLVQDANRLPEKRRSTAEAAFVQAEALAIAQDRGRGHSILVKTLTSYLGGCPPLLCAFMKIILVYKL